MLTTIHFGFALTPLLFLPVIVAVPLALLLLLIVVLVSGRANRSATQPLASTAEGVPPSLDQRRAGLERSRSRYQEERSRILGMLEKGTITPDDADRLFTTLDRETSTMACPYCEADVRIEAALCKHCHRDLVADILKPRRLCKSRDKMLAGVCGGLAEYAGLDSSLIRLLVALVVLFTSIVPGLLIYLVAALVMPDPQ